jgi:hypothetical protein
MKITKLLLWISYIGFALSIVVIGFLGIILLKQDFNAQKLEKDNLKGVISKSTTTKFNLPMNLNVEYYYSFQNGEVMVDSYFLKIQKKFLTNTKLAQAEKKDADFPKQLNGYIYAMPDSESNLYISIPYSSIKSTIAIWKLYFFLASSTLLFAIFMCIRFLQNCDKGLFFVPANTKYIRVISYLAIGFSLVSYTIQWVIFKGLNNNLYEMTSISLDSIIDFNWTFLIVSLFLVLIAQAFTEGTKLKEEQSLTI